MRPVLFRLAIVPLGLAIWAAHAPAGDLDPPGGAVAPTMKTLDQVEPRTIINQQNTPGDADSVFRITSSGSYYLAANSTIITADTCIEVAADDVTIDLMGFEIRGIGAGSGPGIRADNLSVRNIVIKNGSITGFGSEGIFLGNDVEGCRITNVHISDCFVGILAAGGDCHITDCTATGCGLIGIWASGEGGVVRGCHASGNGDTGIIAGMDASVVECTANDNGGNGISISSGVIARCSAEDNLVGFTLQFSALIESCNANDNSQTGITVGNSCVVRDNLCVRNGPGGGAAGIRVVNSNNRVEGNHCVDNTNGITVGGLGNIVVRNTCVSSDLVNFSVAAPNVFGPIVNVGAGGDLGSIAGADHPWANFSR